jgi:competence protein ComEA
MRRIGRAVAVGVLCGLVLGGGRGTGLAADGSARVNVNSASVDELAGLPGIGPAKARAIVEHRSTEPFHKPEDLRKVKGIGDKLYEQVKDRITVGEPGAPSKPNRGS